MIGPIVLAVVLSQTATHKLRWEPRVDLPVTGVLAAGWFVSEFAIKRQLAPSECRWCQTNAFDNAVRSAFNPTLAPSADGIGGPDLASNVLGFVGVPVVALGLDALLAWRDGVFMEDFWTDAVLILEAMMTAQGLNQVLKFTVARSRPYTIDASPELLAQGHSVADSSLSFFSGHAGFTFSLVCSAGTIAGLRGYRNAWVIWAVGLPLAAATSVLRIAADKHWTSDVLIGVAIGTASGILMPTLFHGRVGPVDAQVTPMPNGLAVAGRF